MSTGRGRAPGTTWVGFVELQRCWLMGSGITAALHIAALPGPTGYDSRAAAARAVNNDVVGRESGAAPYSVVAEVVKVMMGAAGFVAADAADAAVDGLPLELRAAGLDLGDDVAAGGDSR